MTEDVAIADLRGVGGRTTVLAAELLCESLDLRPGERVLDVESGDAGMALAAARRFCTVTATATAADVVAQTQRRADAEGVPMTARTTDGSELPFADASFDVVTSSFGVMFMPDQERVANELVRVCRRGGRVGMTNWVPDGMIGKILRAAERYERSPGRRAPIEWGRAARLHELFAEHVSSLRLRPRQLVWRFPTPEHALEYFRTFYPPTMTTFAGLGEAEGRALGDELLTIFDKYDRSGDNTVVAPGDYVEAIAVRA